MVEIIQEEAIKRLAWEMIQTSVMDLLPFDDKVKELGRLQQKNSEHHQEIFLIKQKAKSDRTKKEIEILRDIGREDSMKSQIQELRKNRRDALDWFSRKETDACGYAWCLQQSSANPLWLKKWIGILQNITVDKLKKLKKQIKSDNKKVQPEDN